jgi:hypothetical protein
MRGLGILCILLVTGCALTFDGQRKTTRRPVPSAERVREGSLAGAASLQADGRVQFALALDKLCERDKLVVEEIGVDRKKRFNTGGMVATAASIALVPLGIWMLTQVETDADGFTTDGSFGYIAGGVLTITTGAVVGGFLLGFRYGDPGGYPATKGYEKIEERQVSDGVEAVACAQGVAAVGDLVLATPWGATATARPGGDGVAVFAVEWAAASAVPKAQLAAGWRITSGKAAASWSPDVEQLAKVIAAARDRVLVGGTPAQLSPTLDAKGLEIGGSGQLVVTVKNGGGSTATAVEAKTRSSIAALHGLTFSLGTIQPGATASLGRAVSLGTDIVDDSATVLLVVTDGSGASVELTKKLVLTRALCAGGKLTRAKYDEKRAKLKKTLTDGLLTQAEFERLDADLLRCLE